MRYLIFASAGEAQWRSEAAYSAPEGAETTALWGWIEHPEDRRAALMVPDTPEDAGVGLSQGEYDALLTSEERADLSEELGEDWQPAGS